MECTTTPTANEVGQAEEVEPMDAVDEAGAAVEDGVVPTDDEDGHDPMSGDEETAAPGDSESPDGRTYAVAFHANVHNKHGHNVVQGEVRTALRSAQEVEPIKRVLGLKRGTPESEVIRRVADAVCHPEIVTNPKVMGALDIVRAKATAAHRHKSAVAIAGKKAADKKVAAKARARKALEAANTKLKELVATLEGKEPDDEQKAGMKAAKDRVAACALKLQRI